MIAVSLVAMLAVVIAAPSPPVQAAVCSEVIINGNMEGSGGWQINPGPPTPAYSTAQAHSPTQYAAGHPEWRQPVQLLP
ncbi:MAG: hypothetical protein HZY76_21515 [Anaerolineae bacterium]|nr:MAG: hypothetical protein HZY76_21515 [Anaerolineae bacterium]